MPVGFDDDDGYFGAPSRGPAPSFSLEDDSLDDDYFKPRTAAPPPAAKPGFFRRLLDPRSRVDTSMAPKGFDPPSRLSTLADFSQTLGEFVPGPVKAAIQAPGAGTGIIGMGFEGDEERRAAYDRLHARNLRSIMRGEQREATTSEIIRAAPQLGSIERELQAPAQAGDHSLADAGIGTLAIAGDILSDPSTYLSGGLSQAGRAAKYAAGGAKALDVAGDAARGIDVAAESFKEAQRLQGLGRVGAGIEAASRVVGSPVAGAIYGPELAGGITSSIAEGDYAEALTQGALGGLMAKGIAGEAAAARAARAPVAIEDVAPARPEGFQSRSRLAGEQYRDVAPMSLEDIALAEAELAPRTAGINESFPDADTPTFFPEVGRPKPEPVVERPFFEEPDQPFYVPEESPPPPDIADRSPVPPAAIEQTYFPAIPDETPTFFPEFEPRGDKAVAKAARLQPQEPRLEDVPFDLTVTDQLAAQAAEAAKAARRMPPEIPEGWRVDEGPGPGEFVVVGPDGTVEAVTDSRRAAVSEANRRARGEGPEPMEPTAPKGPKKPPEGGGGGGEEPIPEFKPGVPLTEARPVSSAAEAAAKQAHANARAGKAPEEAWAHLEGDERTDAVDRYISRRGGEDFVKSLARRFGDEGPDGVTQYEYEGDLYFVQRHEGKVVGGGKGNPEGPRQMVAGGRALDSPRSASEIYSAMDRAGILPSTDLSPYGRASQEGHARRLARRDEGAQGRGTESGDQAGVRPLPEPDRIAPEAAPEAAGAAAPEVVPEPPVSARRTELTALKESRAARASAMRAIREAGKKAEAAPTRKRATPRKGTPERAALDEEAAAAEKAYEEDNAKVAELDKQIGSMRSSLKRDKLQRKRNELSAEAYKSAMGYKPLRERAYRAKLEDLADEGDPAQRIIAAERLSDYKKPTPESTAELGAVVRKAVEARAKDFPELDKAARERAIKSIVEDEHTTHASVLSRGLDDAARGELQRQQGQLEKTRTEKAVKEAHEKIDAMPGLDEDGATRARLKEKLRRGFEKPEAVLKEAEEANKKGLEKKAAREAEEKIVREEKAARDAAVAATPEEIAAIEGPRGRRGASPAIKPSKRTGLTESQAEFLGEKLEQIAKADEIRPTTIKVPGDGEFTVRSPQAVARLHKWATGETLPGPHGEAEKVPGMPGRVVGAGKMGDVHSPARTIEQDASNAIKMYGSADKAYERIAAQADRLKAAGEEVPADTKKLLSWLTTPERAAKRSGESGFVATDLPVALADAIVQAGHDAGRVAARAYELAKSGIKDVADFGARMVREFGDGIKAHLEALYDWATDAIESLAAKFPEAAETAGYFLGGPEAMVSKVAPTPLRARPIPPPTPSASRGTAGYHTPDATKIESFDRAVADRYADIERMVKTVREKGGSVPPVFDELHGIRTAGSKKANHIDTIERTFEAPVVKLLKDSGIKWEDAADYVMAKHAPEANRELLRRNAMGHSGMSNSQAAAIIARARANGTARTLERVAREVQRLNDWKLRLATDPDGGIYTPAQVAQFKRSWGDWWVPTRDDAILPDESIFRQMLPRGFDVRRKLQARTGRGARAMDPLAAAFVDAQNVAIAVENNRVARGLADLHRRNPQLLDLTDPVAPTVPRLNPATGKVVHVKDTLSLLSDPTIIGYKEGGQQKFLKFDHPNPDQAAYYAAAFKDMGRNDLGLIARTLRPVTRFMASASTRYNPVFSMIFNPIKDALGSVPTIAIEHGSDVATSVAKRLLPGQGLRTSIFREIMNPGTANPEFRRYVDQGGKISNYNFRDIEDMGNDLKAKVESGKMREGVDSLLKVAGAMNDAMEAATRFALYKELRSRGVSEPKAIVAARNVSLDFDKRGMKTAEPSALYAFFNAHVQGTRRLFELANKNPKGFAAVAGTLFGLGMMQDLVNGAAAGDADDDGVNDYDQMAPWARENNYVFGKVMVPAPPGFSFLHAMGVNAGAVMRGAATKKDAGLNMALAMQSAFNPLGGESIGKGDRTKSVFITGTPTALKPLAEVALNQTQLGSPVRPDQPKFGAKKPQSELHFKSVNWLAKKFAQGILPRVGIDRSPEDIEQLFTGYLGGAGRTASMAMKAAGTVASGELPTPREVPVLSRVYYEAHPSEQGRRYYEAVAELQDAAAKARELRQQKKAADAKELEQGILRARGAFDSAHVRLKSLTEARKRAESEGRDTKMLDASIDAVYRKANKTFAQNREKMGLPARAEAR